MASYNNALIKHLHVYPYIIIMCMLLLISLTTGYTRPNIIGILYLFLCTVVLRKRAHPRMSAHPPVCLEFQLRSNFYLKEHPPHCKWDIPYCLKQVDVVKLTYTHYKVQITQLHSSLHKYEVWSDMFLCRRCR